MAGSLEEVGGVPGGDAIRRILEVSLNDDGTLKSGGGGAGGGSVTLSAIEAAIPSILYYQAVSNPATDEAPALNALIAGASPGTVIQIIRSSAGGRVYVASAIQLSSNVVLDGRDPTGVFITAMAGFSDTQLVRNWSASDWTVGETDHYYAPNTTATPCYYPKIKNIGLDLDSHCTGVTCLALVHPQERAIVENIIYYDTGNGSSGCVCRAMFANRDASAPIAGVFRANMETAYGGSTGPTWKHQVECDATNGGKNTTGVFRGDLCIVDIFTTAGANNCSDSPFVFRSVYSPIVSRLHSQVTIKSDSTAGQQTYTDFTGSSGSVITSGGTYTGTNNDIGRTVSDGGVHIPAGTVIQSVSGSAITLSQAVTGSVSGETITIGPDTAMIRFVDCPGAICRDLLLNISGSACHRPLVRATQSQTAETVIGSSPLLDNIKVLITGGANGLQSGSNVIEDYTFGTNGTVQGPGAIPFSSGSVDPRLIYRYDGSTFLFRHGNNSVMAGNTGYLTPSGGASYTPTGAGALSSSQNELSADVTMTSAATFYDGPTLSLAAGTWFLSGAVRLLASTAATRTWTAQLWDGTTVYHRNLHAIEGTSQDANHTLSVSGIVTLGSTTTLKISASSTATSDVIKTGAVANQDSWLSAVKVA